METLVLLQMSVNDDEGYELSAIQIVLLWGRREAGGETAIVVIGQYACLGLARSDRAI